MRGENLPRGRHGLGPEKVRAVQRSTLLQAMADSVADKGFAATTVADVIERASMSRKTFYELFSGKDDCFDATYDLGVGVLLGAIERAVVDVTTQPDRLEAGLTALTDVLARNPSYASLCIVEVLGAGPQARAKHDRTFGRFRIFLDDVDVRVGETLYGGILGGIASMLFREINEGRTAQIRDITPALVDFVMLPLEALRARGA